MKQTIELEHYNHKVGINFWHINWQTKYRYNMFAKFKYKKLCEACIRKVAHNHNIKIRVINVMPEHVHLTATLPRGMLDEKALQLLKGGQECVLVDVVGLRRQTHADMLSQAVDAILVAADQTRERLDIPAAAPLDQIALRYHRVSFYEISTEVRSPLNPFEIRRISINEA